MTEFPLPEFESGHSLHAPVETLKLRLFPSQDESLLTVARKTTWPFQALNAVPAKGGMLTNELLALHGVSLDRLAEHLEKYATVALKHFLPSLRIEDAIIRVHCTEGIHLVRACLVIHHRNVQFDPEPLLH